MARFCDRCQRDAAFQSGKGDSCPIAAATMVYDEDDPAYPKEWVEDERGPRCTAFVEIGSVAKPPTPSTIKDERQIGLPL